MRNGATVHSAKEVQKELKVLKAKLNELAESIGEDASEATSSLLDSAPKLAKAYGEELLDGALSGAKGLGDTLLKQVLGSIKDRPIGTVAALIGIGFLAGYLCHKDE